MSIIKSPSLLANRWLLVVCLVLPWINPFTSAPSTSVIPLLLSWMLVACALLLVVDEVADVVGVVFADVLEETALVAMSKNQSKSGNRQNR